MNKKLTLSLLGILLLCSMPLFAHDGLHIEDVNRTVITQGVGLGAVIAVVASWSRNQSILWAIVHGIFSWLYVLYFVATKTSAQQG